MKFKIKALKDALKALGISSGTKTRVENMHGQSKVYLNSGYFGIFDYAKGTFVD